MPRSAARSTSPIASATRPAARARAGSSSTVAADSTSATAGVAPSAAPAAATDAADALGRNTPVSPGASAMAARSASPRSPWFTRTHTSGPASSAVARSARAPSTCSRAVSLAGTRHRVLEVEDHRVGAGGQRLGEALGSVAGDVEVRPGGAGRDRAHRSPRAAPRVPVVSMAVAPSLRTTVHRHGVAVDRAHDVRRQADEQRSRGPERERRERPPGVALHRGGRGDGGERAVHHEAGVALLVAGVGVVVVDAVAVEGDRREAEQLDRGRAAPLEPLARPRPRARGRPRGPAPARPGCGRRASGARRGAPRRPGCRCARR